MARALTDASILALDAATLNRLLTWRWLSRPSFAGAGLERGSRRWLERSAVIVARCRRQRAHADACSAIELVTGRWLLQESDVGDGCYFLKKWSGWR
jgi:CRP-like cAMP-binding protein